VDKFVEEIYGFPRHLSIHSGGFTLSRDPLIETVPVEPARMEGRTIVQWDKDDLDAIGLLKVDLLSLGMLSAIRKTCDAVGLPFVSIPPEDPATYEMMCRGDTVGVFQIESRAQMNMLGRLRPRTFYDLVIQVAIVRPGPIVGKMVHPYLKRRRGLESSKSPHPALEPILAKTLGVPLFQEQVMKIAIALAGFTPGEADELRRAIGAWRSSGSIEKMGAKLMKGLLKSGLPREWVERVFQQIKGFAEYGFPESHAASFALLAYASSYLKRHHPAQFTCALLNSLPMGFYAPHTLIEDARRHGVRVLPVHPNLSGWNSAVAPDGALRVGLRAVKGLAETDAHRLLDERARGGAFRGLADFLARARLGRNVLDRLAMGDAFACFGLSQREALWQILAHAAAGDLFSNAESPQAELFEKLSEYEAIRADYASYRLSTRGHPMRALRAAGRDARVPKTTTGAARAAAHDTMASVAGLVIVRQRPSTAGGTIFAALEDEEGFLDLILRESVYRKYEEIFINHSFLVARGRLQRDGHSVSMLVNGIKPLWPENPRNFVRSHDWC
jgi:error-prone DNA polymerase